MTFKTAFPDFDASTLPAIPAAWEDTSWHNDACPSFRTNAGTIVFVDYAKPAEREFPEGARFSVQNDPEVSNSNDTLLETDDWAEVLRFVSDSIVSAARALGITLVSIWAAWDEANETACHDAFRLATQAIRALDLRQLDGVLAAPLSYWASAFLDDYNPEDLTYSEMLSSVANGVTILGAR